MSNITESAIIFEIRVPEFPKIRKCRCDIKLLKIVWDYYFAVTTVFNSWNEIKWTQINTESMDNECKNFAKEIRMLDNEVRTWSIYQEVDNKIKNMIISLKSINDLKNPSIQERHWFELMELTGVKFTVNNSTAFSELLALKFHKFEDEVKKELISLF
jgi:dynein heavy chain, axonemal